MGCNYRLHGRLGYKVSRLARLMEARLEEKISHYGVTRLMWCVLSGVGLEGVHTPSELASYVGVARSAVSRALRSMEKMELIIRQPASGDGRGIEIRLTDKGRDVMEQCRVHVEWLNDHFTSKIADADLNILLRNIDVLSSGETRELERL
ncbi:MarR family winged helix-turn-helix transcriptional regulator [Hoeflea prorocentri]|uniref:MarR family transcriptional regulator n=1 Tax=Hoeflea prorocentri TaxID=1922333 RepID=A0A9X3ZHB1_9HYPH|nr:MarR family transcriptional regulator [Hoeflea prorocentri]MCY6381134.1 MarR family transcriptional regulator [Hoeflea prorocentri]MDA5398934.1 MarR family transcriptional regulator [Hoeflea prorocentri]